MPDKQRAGGVAGLAASWAARAALLIGGVAVAVRFGVPVAEPPLTQSGDAPEEDDSGRGNPGTPASRSARTAGHETDDLNARTLSRLVVGLFSVAAIMVFGMVGFRHLVLNVHGNNRPVLTAQQITHASPPPPNLQRNPVGDLGAFDRHADRLIDNYASIDDGHGRIPIDRAMTLIKGHSLETAP